MPAAPTWLIAQPDAPRPALQPAADENVAAAVDHRVVYAMALQCRHAGLQCRQLGDAAQVDAHARATQHRPACRPVDDEITVIDQQALARELRIVRYATLVVGSRGSSCCSASTWGSRRL